MSDRLPLGIYLLAASIGFLWVPELVLGLFRDTGINWVKVAWLLCSGGAIAIGLVMKKAIAWHLVIILSWLSLGLGALVLFATIFTLLSNIAAPNTSRTPTLRSMNS